MMCHIVTRVKAVYADPMFDRRWLFVIACIAGCQGRSEEKRVETRADQASKAADFWPDAPKTTTTTGAARTITYNPANITGYSITIDLATAPGAEATVKVAMTLGLIFQPGTTARDRDARIQKIDLDLDAGQKMKMHLDHAELSIDAAGKSTRLKRGEAGPLDVAAIMDKAFTTLTFSEANKVTVTSHPDHPLVSLGGDMLDNAMTLFPDFPAQPIAPGYKWTVKHNVPIGNNMGRIDVSYDFTYVGDGACPSGSPSCAHFTFTATSSDAAMETQGVMVKASYGFAGKVFFDTTRGIIDESRVRMDMDVRAEGHSLPLGGSFSVKPIAG